ncbi:hypothetical protein [Chryseobacterium aureum]|uniref:hypothetical protein n=1 Tax=Chryseobacterium aureum TaxID=2497456 RepID=UPI000F897756|nr:hypothetical protein [Chryseobacterium aureum]
MKKVILSVVLLTSICTYSQVGINNNDPKATLDVAAKTTDGSKPEGLIAPRLAGDQIRLGNASYTSAQTGAIIYATSPDSNPAGKTINIVAPGYYYFDGNVWQKVIAGNSADATDDAWLNDKTNTMVKLGTQSDGITARAAGTDVVIKDNGNMGIGTVTPASNAVLELSSSNKGFLPPRIALTGNTDTTTIPSPSAGMIVYNTSTSATLNKGITYYDGITWKQLVPANVANSSAVVDLVSNVTTGNSSSGSMAGSVQLDFGTITAPADGSYAFSFRLYGTTSGSGRGIFYIYLVKSSGGVDTLVDEAELNPYCFGGTDATTYSVTLSAGGASQGDTFKIYIGRYNGGGATSPTWTLRGNPGNNANKTSFTWWKL